MIINFIIGSLFIILYALLIAASTILSLTIYDAFMRDYYPTCTKRPRLVALLTLVIIIIGGIIGIRSL